MHEDEHRDPEDPQGEPAPEPAGQGASEINETAVAPVAPAAPSASAPGASPPRAGRPAPGLYFLGLGLGLLPALMLLVAVPVSNVSTALGIAVVAVLLYLAAIIASIVCLVSRPARSVGYGLLTAVLLAPVVVAIGCSVIINRGSL